MTRLELLFFDLQDALLDKRATVVLAESDLCRGGYLLWDLKGAITELDDRIRLCKERIDAEND